MQESNPFPLSPNPWRLVYQPDPRGSAPFHHLIKIVHSKTYVVHPGPAFINEPANGVIPGVGLEQLHKRFASLKPNYPGAVGVVKRNLRHSEDVAIKIDAFVYGANRDSNVRNPGSAEAWWVH